MDALNIQPTTGHIINLTGLPGVVRVENASCDGEPAMKIIFADGIEATVTRSFINKGRFDVWLPPDRPFMAASMMPNVDEKTVMDKLSKLAANAAAE